MSKPALETLKKRDLYMLWCCFLLYFQLHNMTLAFDLLHDTGLHVASISPQGEEIIAMESIQDYNSLQRERERRKKHE